VFQPVQQGLQRVRQQELPVEQRQRRQTQSSKPKSSLNSFSTPYVTFSLQFTSKVTKKQAFFFESCIFYKILLFLRINALDSIDRLFMHEKLLWFPSLVSLGRG
jgi:hypothetical protein